MVSLLDFKTADGYDWEAYHAAQAAELEEEVRSGKRCRTCHTINHLPSGPHDCWQCNRLKGESEVRHDSLVRCPECRHCQSGPGTFEVCDTLTSRGEISGDVSVWCEQCDHNFEVGCSMTVDYTSPNVHRAEAVDG